MKYLLILVLLLVACDPIPSEGGLEEKQLEQCEKVAAAGKSFDIYRCKLPFEAIIYCGYKYAAYGPALSCAN